ncbi:hypothetical protein HPP92_004664 [Vanilla planifolia]|uniref:Uncharacterized protein n=1 Tax=Vanilla planifolia TaxID=51239 RepID=A0A835RLY0_VANPL|nr:hypothetical protein HPP92_004664 [Vanilla planifolia]
MVEARRRKQASAVRVGTAGVACWSRRSHPQKQAGRLMHSDRNGAMFIDT